MFASSIYFLVIGSCERSGKWSRKIFCNERSTIDRIFFFIRDEKKKGDRIIFYSVGILFVVLFIRIYELILNWMYLILISVRYKIVFFKFIHFISISFSRLSRFLSNFLFTGIIHIKVNGTWYFYHIFSFTKWRVFLNLESELSLKFKVLYLKSRRLIKWLQQLFALAINSKLSLQHKGVEKPRQTKLVSSRYNVSNYQVQLNKVDKLTVPAYNLIFLLLRQCSSNRANPQKESHRANKEQIYKS